MKTKSGLNLSLNFTSQDVFSLLNDFLNLERFLPSQEHTQEEGFDCLSFANERDDFNAWSWLVWQQAIEDQSWTESHML